MHKIIQQKKNGKREKIIDYEWTYQAEKQREWESKQRSEEHERVSREAKSVREWEAKSEKRSKEREREWRQKWGDGKTKGRDKEELGFGKKKY